MSDNLKSQVSGLSPQPSLHAEAIEILSKQVIFWYKQISSLDHSDLPDRAPRASALRERCHSVETSIKHLEGKQTL